MKVLYVYPFYTEGGSSIHAKEFIAACEQLGHQITPLPLNIIIGKRSSSALFKALRLIWNNVRYLALFLATFLKSRPDYVVLRFEPNHIFFVTILTTRLLSKLVLEVNATRTIEPTTDFGEIEKKLDAWSMRLAHRVFVVSSVIKSRLLSSYPELSEQQITVIHNGCNLPPANAKSDLEPLRAQLGLKQFKTLVGYVGSFKAWHDIQTILTATSQTPKDIGFLIVGDGPERQYYQQQADAMKVTNLVFTGDVPHSHVYDYISLFDIALLTVPNAWCTQPGGFHGSPLKLFDYMAMGKPVIATASGDIADIIEDGINGFHIEPEDVKALVKKILYLHTHKDQALCMGQQGQAKIALAYTWQANAKRVIDLCSSI